MLLSVLFVLGSGKPAAAQPFGIAALLNPEGSRLFPQLILYPRHPGKPDPRWRSFDWRFTDNMADHSRYRLYFYEEEDWSARFAMPRIRQQVENLSRTFEYSPSKQFSYLLFTSQREFGQANIFFVSEGVQGITSTEEATMAIPYWGDTQTFDHISHHEMAHQFQVQRIKDAGGPYASARMQMIPLWFIEGMAEYYSLKGLDPESRVYLRDLLLHPKKDRGHVLPKLFQEGAMGFVNTYKVGQAKIDYLEKTFGPKTVQRILVVAAQNLVPGEDSFPALVSKEVGKSPEELEKGWTDYTEGFRKEANALPHGLDAYEKVKEAGDTLDLFDASPDGTLLAIREVDPLSGTTSIQVVDLTKKGFDKTEAAHDNQPGLLSLNFMQWPSVAISNHWIAYVADTSFGPELELRGIERDGDGDLELGSPIRIELHDFKLLEANAVALSPDEKNIAIIGLTQKGWGNVYVIDNFPGSFPGKRHFKLRALTEGYYSWRGLSWGPDGIFSASDRTANGKYAIMRLDPRTGSAERVSTSAENLLAPASSSRGLVFQGWDSGSPQAHLLTRDAKGGSRLRRITGARTGLYQPRYVGETLHALVFESGRYQLYRVPDKAFLDERTGPEPATGLPWTAKLEPLQTDALMRYRPFRGKSGIRIDNLAGFLTTGSYGGLAGSVSDLMRNYSISAELAVLGGLDRTSASAFISSQKGRATWTTGAYHTIQPRLDNLFDMNGSYRTYLHREYGILGAYQYPIGSFSYFDLELRLSGVNRSDFSDPRLVAAWEARNPGTEFLVAPMFRYGYDRVLYEAYTGPLRGFGFLTEFDTSIYPKRNAVSERFRADIAQYWQLAGRTVLAVQAMGAATFGERYKSSFLVSSDDIMRAYSFDDDRLYGNYLLATKAELRFPIGSLFNFPPLRGLAAYDLGSIFTKGHQVGSRIASSYTGGLSFNLPPISLNLMISHPLRTAPSIFRSEANVFHFTLRYLYI
ncbi:MAG: outer membrane protein assembly factor [Oligoflexia bacterium]|nr:outer membrane protein assembly factor [Oligoflexia bacterium]